MALFAAPLFIGLGLWDMRNDESIYSYAVERILETNRWLTPRSIPGDDPFLEKPPLKFWIVAGAIDLGLLPNNEYGMRFFDALFGAFTFAYVLAIAWRLAGPVAGFVALLILFVFDPLLFEHGFRSNNMEGALVLAYAGGMFHFLRWVEGTARPRRRLHALAFAGYFVLGFLTKFVAAVFLPFAAALAFVWRRGAWADLRARWTEWLWPAGAALAAIAPWFLYQWRLHGMLFWQIILGEHIYQRFTASLDPDHVQPWHYYFSQMWREFAYAEALWLVVPGLVLLVWAAVRGRPWPARLILLWWLAPLTLMSLGTSKLFHYAYPFVLPIAIAAGWFAAAALGWIDARIGTAVRDWAGRQHAVTWAAERDVFRRGLVVVAVLLGALSLWTFLRGEPVTWMVGETRLFRNSSVPRPLVLAVPLLVVAGLGQQVIRAGALIGLVLVLPVGVYASKFERLSSVDRPLHIIRNCMLELSVTGVTPRTGVYISDWSLVAHPYYYYFRKTGPWAFGEEQLEAEARVRLFQPGAQTPMIMSASQRRRLRAGWYAEADANPAAPRLDMNSIGIVATSPGIAVLLPGPFHVCLARADNGRGNVYIPGATADAEQ